MPKCKNCGAKMPKGYNYCGECGADMTTGLIPWSKPASSPKKEENAPKPNKVEVQKAPLVPNENIDTFVKDTPNPKVQPVVPPVPPRQPRQARPNVPIQPQQQFKPATEPVKDTPTPKVQPIVPPVPPRQPRQARPNVPIQPQQQFKPVTEPLKDTPNPKVQPIVPPVPPRQARPNVPIQPQQQFKPVVTDMQEVPTPKVAQLQSVKSNQGVPKPAYVPKPNQSEEPIQLVKVPDVTGRNQELASTELEKLGLKVAINTDNSNIVKPECVISQSVRTGTEVVKGTTIQLVVSVGTWSEWSTTKVMDNSMYVIEQKKEFRFRTRNREIETHDSTERNLPGYTCIDQKTVYSDWEDEGYYTTEDRPTSETNDISTNLIGFKYCGYSYIGSQQGIDTCYSTKQTALIFNPNTKPEDWEYNEVVLFQDIKPDTIDWFPTNDIERVTPAGDDIDCNIKMTSYIVDGKRYAMKYGSLSTEWFLYHSRKAIETIYTYKREYFTDWSDWSDWVAEAPVQDELNEVEARVLYRSRRKTSKDM